MNVNYETVSWKFRNQTEILNSLNKNTETGNFEIRVRHFTH
jgi:hypothetical protein